MVRAILYLLASILLITVVRSVVGIIMKGFGELFSSKPPQPPPVRPPGSNSAQALKKDPVCGTYVPESSPYRKSAGGSIHYFCSENCRDKFVA